MPLPRGLGEWQTEEVGIRIRRHGEIEDALRLQRFKSQAVVQKLAQGCVKTVEQRWPQETLDFDRDVPTFFLGSDQFLGPKVNVQINVAELNDQRI